MGTVSCSELIPEILERSRATGDLQRFRDESLSMIAPIYPLRLTVHVSVYIARPSSM